MLRMEAYSLQYHKTKTGELTAKVSYFDTMLQKENHVLLCSKFEPTKEGKQWAEHIYSQEINVFYIYGLGMGYHIKALLEMMQEAQKVSIIETNTEVYEALQEQGIFDFLEGHDRQVELLVTKNMSQITERLARKGKEESTGKTMFFVYRPSLKLIPKALTKFREILEIHTMIPSRELLYQAAILENYAHNNNLEQTKPFVYKNVSLLYGKIARPIVLVSGGASLGRNINILKEIQDKVFIFSTGRTLKMLLAKGIRVDLFCIIDPLKSGTYVQIDGIEKSAIPAVFLNTTSYETVAAYEGPKYLAYSEDSPLEQEGRIETGESVATAMLDLAIRFGGEPIVFIGQDLAYTQGKTHAEGARGEAIEETPNMRKVMGIQGDYLPTTLGFLKFKHWIERKISLHPEKQFYNCSVEGAYIEGCIHCDLEHFR